LHLDVAENEFVSIAGPSGAGKTTLLNLIGGIDVPTSGEICVFRQNLANLDEECLAVFRCANIGFVFQNYNLISTLTTEENISFPMELAGWNQEHIQKRIGNLLKMVGLADRADHFPSQLSGGEQQRAAFARALANDPPLLLVDEPTANLDKKTGSVIVSLLKNWKTKKTIIVATHDQEIIELADRKFSLRLGKLTQ
jgi:putative ABC transport system ATP-binding protein